MPKKKTEKRKIRIFIFAAAAVALVLAFIVVLNNFVIPSSNYKKALELYESGEYTNAYLAFRRADGYEDSVSYLEDIEFSHYKDYLRIYKTGDRFNFGCYEQDNDDSNGKEPIFWRVLLEDDGDRMLLISDYALDAVPFNMENEPVTWETCSLRNWLNYDFYKSAFTEYEMQMIIPINVSADENTQYYTDPGNSTVDNVFLLSMKEADEYFSSDSDRKCTPTRYTEDKGAFTSTDGLTWWWLRTPGYDGTYAVHVNNKGEIQKSGTEVYAENRAVRPAIWISLAEG